MFLLQTLRYLWVLPASLLGLLPLPLVLLQGGRARLVDGVLEIHGGIVVRILRKVTASAMTLGHVVWGCDAESLEVTRLHERVHVRQYERWGPLFIPAYLMSSLVAFLRGKNPYRDNRFEREAFAEAP